MSFVKWPSIESFAHVRKAVDLYGERVGETSAGHQGPIAYRAKIKLHGTNAGVGLSGGDVTAQKRGGIATLEQDNAGFAAWVHKHRDYWDGLRDKLPQGDSVTVFGEWCGPGIQKGAAICGIPNKMFAVFAVRVDDQVYAEPDVLKEWMADGPDVIVLPWAFAEPVEVDFTDETSMRTALEFINAQVEQVDALDPFVKEVFDVEGPGEGFVWYPTGLGEASIEHGLLAGYMFKTKGEKHQVVRVKKAATMDPETAASIDEFVRMFVTENRLEQIAQETLEGDFDPRKTGQFLGAFSRDVQKESGPELEASGLDWKKVQKAVTAAARTWFIEKTRSV